MKALIVVDAQNEFSAEGKRPVPSYRAALEAILVRAEHARRLGQPIAWVRHYNRPHESAAFVPGTWGSELSAGCGPLSSSTLEALFEKDVFGAFTGTSLESWLRSFDVSEVVLGGFYTHMCVSTSSREALVRGFEVAIDARATAACDLEHAVLGRQTAAEVHRTALLQLASMGAIILDGVAQSEAERPISMRLEGVAAR